MTTSASLSHLPLFSRSHTGKQRPKGFSHAGEPHPVLRKQVKKAVDEILAEKLEAFGEMVKKLGVGVDEAA